MRQVWARPRRIPRTARRWTRRPLRTPVCGKRVSSVRLSVTRDSGVVTSPGLTSATPISPVQRCTNASSPERISTARCSPGLGCPPSMSAKLPSLALATEGAARSHCRRQVKWISARLTSRPTSSAPSSNFFYVAVWRNPLCPAVFRRSFRGAARSLFTSAGVPWCAARGS